MRDGESERGYLSVEVQPYESIYHGHMSLDINRYHRLFFIIVFPF